MHRHEREPEDAVGIAREGDDVDDRVCGERAVQVGEPALDLDLVAELGGVDHEEHQVALALVHVVGRGEHLLGTREVHEALAFGLDATVGPLRRRCDPEQHQVSFTAVARS